MYIQLDKVSENVIIAMTEAKPETMEDINGIWLEVEDDDVIIAENSKMYYKQADAAELKEFRKARRIAEIPREIAKLETARTRPLQDLELMTLGIMDEAEKDTPLNELKQIQVDIEALRSELAKLNKPAAKRRQSSKPRASAGKKKVADKGSCNL